jgi:hypothetical protein
MRRRNHEVGLIVGNTANTKAGLEEKSDTRVSLSWYDWGRVNQSGK